MTWQEGISGVQLSIAAETRSPVHVLAGPGTGKTLAMMRRIARLLEEGADPKRILAVSFTRTAARDLREQLLQLGATGAEAVDGTTLHSLCFSALLVDAVFEATQRRARPLMAFEINQLAHDLKERFGGKREVPKLIEAYDAAWARLQHETAGPPKSAADLEFESALLDWLRYHRAMLIGELVPITLRFLQDNPHAAVLPVYDAVLVDEYQDLNKADQTLLDLFAVNAQLMVIGDDNQSIYRFRHANPEGIQVFPASHAGTVSYLIDECWRCPPNIVHMSNSLIAHDPSTRATPIQAQPGRPTASVAIVQHATLEDESDALGAYIDWYLASRPELPPGQVLVLSPRRIFGNAIRDALLRRHRNAMSFFWEDALSAPSAAEGFCLLTLAVSPQDRAAYRAWVGLRHADGNTAPYRRVRVYAEANDLEPREVCDRMVAGQLHLPYTANVVARHRALQSRLAQLEGLEGLPLVDALWDGVDLGNRTVRIAAQTIAMAAPKPADLLDNLRDAITQPELPDSGGDVIRVMSLHKSKGLTAALVIVAGCVGGAIPTIEANLSPTEQDATLKEQRRLFYVAITRAREALVLSSVTRLPLKTAKKANIPAARVYRQDGETFARLAASPFIGELGPDAPSSVRGSDWRATLGF